MSPAVVACLTVALVLGAAAVLTARAVAAVAECAAAKRRDRGRRHRPCRHGRRAEKYAVRVKTGRATPPQSVRTRHHSPKGAQLRSRAALWSAAPGRG